MTAVRSSTGYLGLGKQSLKGTGVEPTKFCRLNAAEGFEIVQDVLEVRSLNGDEEMDAIYKVANKPNGTFQTLVRPDLGSAIMAWVLGADSVVTGTTHTHTITRADTLPWITVERELDNVERVADCKISQVVINGAANQPLSMDVTYMGIDSSIVSSATETYETDEPFMFHDGVFTIHGAGNTNIKAFTLTINRNLEEIFTTSYKRNDIVEGAFSIDLNYSLVFQASDAIYPAILYGASTAIVDTLYDGAFIADFDYGSGATARQFKFTLPQMKVISAAKHLDPNTQAVTLEIASKAITGGSEIITVECVSGTSTDYA